MGRRVSAENWPLISALLDEALDLPAAERAAWLDALPPERLLLDPSERLAYGYDNSRRVAMPDAVALAESAGGVVDIVFKDSAAWMPVSRVDYGKGEIGVFPHLLDRYKPGIIGVLANGQRFTNESNSYHDVGAAMVRACAGQAETAMWLVCDKTTLAKYGIDFAPVPPRYRSTYFTHIFAGGYAAGYYSYKWAEVLSADAYAAFEESASGAAANVETGRKYREAILEAGGSRPAMESFKAFRGREPSIDALMRHQGMA